MSRRLAGWCLAIALVAIGCTSEKAVPIDLDSGTESTVLPAPESGPVDPDEPIDPEDPNAESKKLALGFAEQQCLDDPSKDEGVVQVADPATGTVVAEVRVDCELVRSRQSDGS